MKRIVFVLTALLCVLLCACADTSTSSSSSASASGGYFVTNPWEESSNEDIAAYLGVGFAIPEGASDVIFRLGKSMNMGEARFTIDGVEWNARISKADALEDTTGMYYSWTSEKESKLSVNSNQEISGVEKFYESDAVKAYAGMWFYENSSLKLVYSISATCSDKMPDPDEAKKVFENTTK